MDKEAGMIADGIGLSGTANESYVGFSFPDDPQQNARRLEIGLEALLHGGSVSFTPEGGAVRAVATFPNQNGADVFGRRLEKAKNIQVLNLL